MTPEHWEHGSELHWPTFRPSDRGRRPWDGLPRGGFGSGRDALRALVHHGGATRGWRRLWLPDYFCQEVASSLLGSAVELQSYPDDPRQPCPMFPGDTGPGDALLVVNTFGLRAAPGSYPPGVDVIEDHSHDLGSRWAFDSNANFALASLRKSLPVPDGGLVWSPKGHPLPKQPRVTDRRLLASAAKLAAMLLKALYLEGHPVEKVTFRRISLAAEQDIAAGDPSAISQWTEALLELLPVDEWREVRRKNHRILGRALSAASHLEVLGTSDAETVPYSAVLVVDSQQRREALRQALIARQVYPAVLWPLEKPVVPVSKESLDLSRRVLSVHCDARYSRHDMEEAARRVLDAEQEVS